MLLIARISDLSDGGLVAIVGIVSLAVVAVATVALVFGRRFRSVVSKDGVRVETMADDDPTLN